ncbi:MAG: NifB/NifX family molybdenum-iron cluster-binding protein [Coriobacteriia bacterium]|nr:NifB/NifX family molybdenum-iron cluster-binding protein [Coriobacteriia bacterium]
MTGSVKVAIPTTGTGGLDAERSAHFGHAESFTIVEVADGRITGSEVMVNPPHSHGGCGMTVNLLAGAGVGTVIVVGMGGGPLAAMNAHGMTPLYDDESPTPRAAVEAFLAGRLVLFGSDNTCRGH